MTITFMRKGENDERRNLERERQKDTWRETYWDIGGERQRWGKTE